jgi:hypothetical protein
VIGENCNMKSVIRIIKSMRMRWVEHVAIIREKMDAYRILVGKTEKGDNLENQEIGEWTILQWILVRKKLGGMGWIDLAQDRGSTP